VKLDIQHRLPSTPPAAVSCRLTILASPTGATSVHVRLETVPEEETLCVAAALLNSWQDGAQTASAALDQLLRVLPTLVNPPPFD
jgi:hypothetical protein